MSRVKKLRNILEAVTRIVARIIFETLHRLAINLFDGLFGFLNWPEKKLRAKILILRDAHGNAVCDIKETEAAIEYAKISFKKNFNVKLLPHRNGAFVEILQKLPPGEVLYTKGGIGALQEEFKIPGRFFASNRSGSFYPVTAFIVTKMEDASGCSLGPISDYVTVDTVGVKRTSVLAHELAHACGLWHVNKKSNLLYPYSNRGNEISWWWQKNVFRSSRHVTYW